MQVISESPSILEEPDNISSREIERGSFMAADIVANEEEDQEELLNRERRQVRGLRALMVLVLLACTVLVVVLTHKLVSKTTTKKMEVRFEESSDRLFEGFERQMNLTVYATWSLSSIVTFRYKGMDIWPNVTLPDFDLQCIGLYLIARARTITLTPLVNSTTNRLAWEQYAAEHADLLGAPSVVYRTDNTSWIVADGIFRFENGDQVYDPGYNALSQYPYTLNPLWQVYPLENNTRLIMMNGNTEQNVKRTRALDDMIHYAVPTLTAPLQLSQDNKTSPSTILMFPILDDDNDIDGADLEYHSNTSAKVVGISGVAYSWDAIFDDILSYDVKGLICVLKASTGEASTFQVDGPVATYIGDGDLHDTKYDDWGKSRYTSIAKVSDKLAIADNLVTYSLSIYPSQSFKNQFDTSTVRNATLTSVFLFLFVTALFFLYDHLLYTEIKRLSNEAHSGNKIVNSLYPKGVRDRLLSMNIKNKNKKDSKSIVSTISTFLTLGYIQSSDDTESISITSEPICDQFPSVSIVFSDIPGFRSWSSAHSPQEMFSLLESVFGEFDRVAKKLGIFKVETIEDCYVAVAGVPDPRDDHAIVMAQFALECQRKFNKVVKSLKNIDAEDLRLRSGLHSGSITAGILRGEKSRFQLFGDTMNTASRMESTGVPTKVHISEQTAELLTEAGKSSWFIPREEKIWVKGKGTLQTYLLIPNVHMKKSLSNNRVTFAARRLSNLTKQLKSTRNLSVKDISTRNIMKDIPTTNFDSKISEHEEQDEKQ